MSLIRRSWTSIKHNKKTSMTIGAILLLLLAVILNPKKTEVETSVIGKGIFELSYEEEGMTRVREKYTLYSPVSGVLKRIEKNAGETVKKGETLFEVDWDYKRKVSAPISGTILKILRKSEGPVTVEEPILELGDTTKLEITSEFLTQNAVHIHTGNLVKISGWGGDWIDGKVRQIEPAAYTKVSSLGVEEQRVRIIIDFTPPEKMGEGYKVICRIISRSIPDSILIPTSALFREGNSWKLYKVVKNKALKTDIQIEHRSGKFAIGSGGVQVGDRVVVYPPENLTDGMKINPSP